MFNNKPKRVCVSVCVSEREKETVYVCVCVCAREREKEAWLWVFLFLPLVFYGVNHFLLHFIRMKKWFWWVWNVLDKRKWILISLFRKHYLSDILGQIRTERTGCVSIWSINTWPTCTVEGLRKSGDPTPNGPSLVTPAAEHAVCPAECDQRFSLTESSLTRAYKQEMGGGLSPWTLAVLLQLYRMASSPKAVPACISPSSFPFWVTSSKPSAVVQKHQTVEPQN